MLTAYFDESGDQDNKQGSFTVAGSISTDQKWLRLDKQWNSILNHHRVSLFHMNECARGTGAFEGWTSDRKRELIAELSDCLARHAKQAFAVTVLIECWSHINEEFQLNETFGHPYGFCGRFCVFMVRSWMKRKKVSAPVEYCFEDGTKHKGELIKLIEVHDHLTPQFKGKELPGLQAADLVAWKNRRVVHDIINRPDSMMGDNFLRSLAPVSKIPRRYHVFDEKELLAFCRRHSVPARI